MFDIAGVSNFEQSDRNRIWIVERNSTVVMLELRRVGLFAATIRASVLGLERAAGRQASSWSRCWQSPADNRTSDHDDNANWALPRAQCASVGDCLGNVGFGKVIGRFRRVLVRLAGGVTLLKNASR